MPKKDFKITIENNNNINHINVKGIISDDTIKYKESDDTLTIFDYNKNLLTRENKELKMIYRFLANTKSEGTIEIKDLKQEMKVIVDTKSIKRDNLNIEICFDIEDNHFIYRIEEIV